MLEVHSILRAAYSSLGLLFQPDASGRAIVNSGAYILSTPTLALVQESDHHIAISVPRGDTITVTAEAFCGDRLIEVTWAGKTVLMFADDLRARTQRRDNVISIDNRKTATAR